MAATGKGGLDAEGMRGRHPRLDVIPFESETKFMATLHEGPDGQHLLLVKGAPEVILPRCRRAPAGAAAAIYAASLLCNEKKTQREVADVAQVTEVTIRNRYQEQIEAMGIHG